MDYLKKIEEVIIRLEKHGYFNQARQITSLRDAASVSSELLLSVTHELLKLVNTDINVKNLIGESVLELKDFCWSIGLQVK
ncbi:MAG: hypothetical protein JWP94_3552 [Mucilaginibacter sp.]|jgi:hypothetical protein|nr:hypothetical protein [Mucilaginibacter sp.]